MVKTYVSMLCAVILLFAGAVFEARFISGEFNDFHQTLTILYEKTNDKTAVEDDVLAVQERWHTKKETLHAFIPHTEIKEMELWLAETVTLVRDGQWEDAVSKVTVMLELSEQIPKTFLLRMENIL